MELTVGNVIKESIAKGLKNFAPLAVNVLLWIVTFWIPYINIGTTIGLFVGIMTKIAKDEPLSMTEIFNEKYRKNFGEYIIVSSLMAMGIYVGMLFMVIPGIIIAIAWSLAVPLVIDKEINPSEAISLSNKLTYGHKWAIFGSQFLLGLIIYIAIAIVTAIVSMILGFLGALVGLAGFALMVSIMIAAQSVIYNSLTAHMNPKEIETNL